jgi:hypothetical protein
VPIVFASINIARFQELTLPPQITGVAVQRDLEDTMNLPLRIHPDTVRVIIPAGASPVERTWLESVRESFREYENRVALTYLADLRCTRFCAA